MAGPALWREDEAVFFYLLWLKTHLYILEKQTKSQCKLRKLWTCICPSLILSNFIHLHRICVVCGGEQDLSGKYLQWFVGLCAQVLF